MPAATVDYSQRICEVWACNVDEEMKKIRQVIQKYNYIAMDTEFPGVVARPIGEFRSNADYQYQLLRCNVDLLKIIQLGLTFMNEQGEYPPGTSTWQFNFKFNLTEDMYARDSIELLTTHGIQFKKHDEEGIETQYFAELLMTSGVVLYICTLMIIVALFTIAKIWKQSKFLSTDEWIKKIWYTHTMQYYLSIKRMRYCHLQQHGGKWRSLC
uniref:poly(A)-specific ribonuclease n=1 Tax=Rhinopithecus bieti TaxID=61621 RepID=A0A2K6MW54_RHIBE